MPRDEDLQKATLNLRAGDMDYLAQVYRPHGIPASLVIRRLVSNHVEHLRAKEGPLTLNLGAIEK